MDFHAWLKAAGFDPSNITDSQRDTLLKAFRTEQAAAAGSVGGGSAGNGGIGGHGVSAGGAAGGAGNVGSSGADGGGAGGTPGAAGSAAGGPALSRSGAKPGRPCERAARPYKDARPQPRAAAGGIGRP